MARSYVREARRRVGPKRERIGPIIERLAGRVPRRDDRARRFATTLELLVSVMLSAQTTDVNVNRVTEQLFEKYRAPEDYLAVPPEELEHDICATGFFRQKAKAVARDDGDAARGATTARCRRTMDELLRLPGRRAEDGERRRRRARQGAGDRRRHARAPALAAARADAAGGSGQDRARPGASSCRAQYWNVFPHLLIWHGRRVCIARTPRCEACVLNDLCPASRVEVSTVASHARA